MTQLTLFESFYQALGTGEHALASDTIKVALSNVAPDIENDATLSDITQIAAGNGYSTGGFSLANVNLALSGGVAVLTADDQVITASGGSMAEWRYAVYYNDTADADGLIGFLDLGAAVNLGAGQSETLDHTSNGLIRFGRGVLA